MFRPEARPVTGEPVTLGLAPFAGGEVQAQVLPITGAAELAIAARRSAAGAMTSNALETVVLGAGMVRLSGGDLAPGELLPGDRNRLILAVLCAGYDAPRDLMVGCPGCGSVNEVPFDPAPVLAAVPRGPVGEMFDSEDCDLRMRLPVGGDLAGAAALLQRCAPGVSDPRLVARVEAEIAARDPCAEIRFRLKCVDCDVAIDSLLDPLALLIAEMDRCGGIFAEIDRIARAYHWSESELRRLPACRRRQYLRALDEAAQDLPQQRAS